MTPFLEQLLSVATTAQPQFDDEDPALRRQRLAKRLADHPDPLLREIGEALQSGRLQPRDIVRTPEYRATLHRAIARFTELDLTTGRADPQSGGNAAKDHGEFRSAG